MEIRIYVADLAAYNDGRLIGEWVTLPVDEDELSVIVSRLTNDGQGDYAIHDYEAPFDVSEYDNPHEVNALAQRLEDCDEDDEDVIRAVLSHFSNADEGIAKLESGDYRVYHDCDDMSDVADEFIEESGLLSGVPDTLQRYFDYEAYGRDLEIEGTFIRVGDGKSMYVQIID